MAHWLQHCAASLQVVGSNLAHRICFPWQTSLGYVTGVSLVRLLFGLLV